VDYIGPSLAPSSTTTVNGTGVFAVLKLFIDLNIFEGGPPPKPMTLTYDPGRP
jgi:hypothetical protein